MTLAPGRPSPTRRLHRRASVGRLRGQLVSQRSPLSDAGLLSTTSAKNKFLHLTQ